jgi:predicted dehydrogenase
LLGDDDIDVVYISLPNSLHAEWTIRSVEAEKHVLCEKPLAISVAEVDAIIEKSSRAGKIVAEAIMYRHHPQTLRVKELIDGGGVGSVILVKGSFTFLQESRIDIRLDPKLGGGSLWFVGCYPVSYARFVIGAEPREVFGWQVVGSTGVDEVLVGQMEFPGNVYAQFDCGFRGPSRNEMEIIGSKGTLSMSHPFKPDLHPELSLRLETESRVFTLEGQKLFQGEVENIADAILNAAPPRVSLRESRGNIAAIEALLRSAREGRPVRLP